MSIWAGIFSAPEIVSKATDAIINTGDALVFTEEERSKANMKKLEWVLKFHEASKGSNIARRWIAIIITSLFAISIFTIIVMILIDATSRVIALQALLADVLVLPMSMIFGFYFGTSIIRDWPKNEKKD